MANTAIRIKRSTSNSSPVSLSAGELAYSYTSNVIFIGNSTGTGVVNIGGYFYTAQIDAATSANTASTIVKRDSNNGFFGALYGNANTATALLNARNFSIDGSDVDSSAVSFDGTGAVVLQGNLKTTGVSAGTYGGQTQIPVFTVDSKGRLTQASNVSVATTLSFAGDTGTANLDLLTDTLTIAGRSGISTISVDANNTVLIDVDNTVVRSNTNISMQLIDGDIQISGNLIVLGNTTSVNVSTLSVEDSLISLARNNTTDAVDIGFYGHYNDGTNRHTGVYRHAGNQQFYVFDNYDQDPVANTINPADASFRLATLNANLTANTANVNQALRISSGAWLYSNGSSYFDGTSQFNGNVTTNNVTVEGTFNANTNIFAPNIPNATTGNLVYYDTANGRFSYASDNALTPTSIANGSYSLSIQSSDGRLIHNGQGIQLANGAIIKDTSGDAVAFGQFAGTLNQGLQAVAIGDSAGYNTQGAYGIAIGYGAGNVSQGQQAVAIGINAGIVNQGLRGVAIGSSAGSSQGAGAIAVGFAAGSSAGADSIVIGTEAGKGNTSFVGANTVAIGRRAGYESAFAGSIILNASGSDLSSSAAGLYINPVRYTATQDATYDGLMFYNSSTKEVRYSYELDGGNF